MPEPTPTYIKPIKNKGGRPRIKPLGPKEKVYPDWQVPQFGRPTDYKPEYCDRVVQLGIEGKGMICELGADLAVSASTINYWRKTYLEFDEAVKLAQTYAEAHWVGRYDAASITDGKNMNGQYIQLKMANAYKWRDARQDHIHSGSIEMKTSPALEAWQEYKQLSHDEVKIIEIEKEPRP